MNKPKAKIILDVDSTCKLIGELQKELSFYRSNCIVLEEGVEPEVGDIVRAEWFSNSTKAFKREIFEIDRDLDTEHLKKLGWTFKILQRQGKPVIIKSKEV